ncbi:DDE-type integrase/transposase/recombinase [Paraburkholderia sp. 40]|uniref:Ig domain-containing protein n=1 Tax=Paraburkholderia sp. 40 TaxID=2991059 RepID=UPI003D1DFF22
MQITRCLTGLLVLLAMLFAGCQGGSSGGTVVTQGPPAGMSEHDESVVYAQGQEIIPDTPSSSGGTITQYSVSPPLPAGLSLNPQTGAITGTPTAVSNATIYTITGTNAAGSTTTLVEIEVKATDVAPDSLSLPHVYAFARALRMDTRCLMRMAGLCGASRRRRPRTTRPGAGGRRAPDLVRRRFSADATNVLWVADATYVPTGEGFLYLAVVLDVFSRRIIGWAMSNHLYTELMLRALDMALQQRRHDGVIRHSVQGSIEAGHPHICQD